MSDSTVRPQDSSAPATTQWYAMSAQDVAEKLGSIPIGAVRCRCFGLPAEERAQRLTCREPAAGLEDVPRAVQELHADHPGGRRGRVDRDRRDIHRHSGPADHSFERTGGMRQQGKAESAMNALQSMLKTSARVRRDGTEVKIDADQVVVGDVVLLAAGDDVCADGRLI